MQVGVVSSNPLTVEKTVLQLDYVELDFHVDYISVVDS